MNSATHQRCTAHSSRTKQPCKRWAIAGGTVCATHGGRAPQVQKAAAERLKELQLPAITAIEGALGAYAKDEPDHPTRLRAATAVLDRTGLGPTSKQEVALDTSEQLKAVLLALEA